MINTVGPVWEGNQVWLILGAGAIFAAWPALYAASFSGFYLAMLLVLAALILRPVGFKFRSKMPGHALARELGLGAVRRRRGARAWCSASPWEICWRAFRSALIPSLRATYTFGLFDLLNPFAILCGIVSIAMLLTHGAVYLAVKTDGEVARRARTISRLAAVAWVLLFSLAGLWLWRGPFGFAITAGALPAGHARSFGKDRDCPKRRLVRELPPLARRLAGPRSGSGGSLAGRGACQDRDERLTVFIVSSLGIAGVIGSMGVSLFPFLLPILLSSAEQPHGVGRLEQSSNPRHHAGCRDHLSADRARVHGLGISRHARAGDERVHRS